MEPTRAQIEAALDAKEATRHIQGFLSPPELVIRDMRLPADQQVIWRGPDSDREAYAAALAAAEMREILRAALALPGAARAELERVETRVLRHKLREPVRSPGCMECGSTRPITDLRDAEDAMREADALIGRLLGLLGGKS